MNLATTLDEEDIDVMNGDATAWPGPPEPGVAGKPPGVRTDS